ncbi:hypothetical protein M011DRAFT_468594 [Sporormia fimetaria CBS 119925]|uniref:Secreted protein n=1 Tax=Sporormia fimetaria CBS 119925 TaxID=1340428 RepID=A0A6A6V713_9PLEO|nr:hypothetical protein M011DRAFT_468594 [Sporormia fimetaria CBS 119925]
MMIGMRVYFLSFFLSVISSHCLTSATSTAFLSLVTSASFLTSQSAGVGMKRSDFTPFVPGVPSACPYVAAPTSSQQRIINHRSRQPLELIFQAPSTCTYSKVF